MRCDKLVGMSTRPCRRLLILGLSLCGQLVFVLAAVSCSEDRPPLSSSGGTATAGGGNDRSREGGAQRDSASFDGGNGSTPIADATADVTDGADVLPCLDESSVTIDGGAGPTECTSSSSCSAYCSNVRDHYKLGIAQTAIACIAQLGGCSNVGEVGNCVDKAIGRACKDSTSPAYCSPLVTSCDPAAGQSGSNVDEDGCERFANALSAAGRSTFSGCIQSKIDAGTCATEIVTCGDEIRR